MSCPYCVHPDSQHGQYGCFVKVGSASCDDAYCSCSWVPPAVEADHREYRRRAVLERGRCRKHPTYAVLRQPRSACEACWRMYVEVNP